MANTYTIQKGDTLSKIAQNAGVDVNTLASANNISNPNLIQAGATLNLPKVQPIISANDLQNTSPVDVPAPAPENLDSLIQSYQPDQTQTDVTKKETQLSQEEKTLRNLQTQLGGQTADQLSLSKEAGIPQLNKDLLDLQNKARQQLIQYQTTPYSLEGQGRGIPTSILRGQEAVKQRQLAVDIMLTNSQIQAKQGDINLALNTIDNALKAKYDPIKNQIDIQKTVLEQLYNSLDRADKKLADEKKTQLDLQLKKIEQDQVNEKAVNDIALQLAQNGADNATINEVRKATSVNEAISIAGSKLQDPKLKLQLESIRLDNILKRESIKAKQLEEIALSNKKQEEIKTGQSKKDATITELENKTALIDSALANIKKGSAVVGTSALFRGGGILSLGIPGALDRLTGQSQDLLGSLEQLTSKEFLQSVLNLKAQGGTLGQLTEQEGAKLQAAATKIGSNAWTIKDKKGNIIGYRVSERQMIDELNKIRTSTQKILSVARGTEFSIDEQNTLNSIFDSSGTALQVSGYYSK